MLENTKSNFLVDFKDLTCPICYLPFGIDENLPVSVNCGHTFCSACIRRLDRCAICKTQFRKRLRFNKSILISSLLEKNSKAKKCAVHQKPVEGFCLEKKELVCFECLVNRQEIISIKDIEEKVENLAEILSKAQQYSLFEVEKFLATEQKSFKKRIDNLLSQEFCYTIMLQERLYDKIQDFMIVGKDDFQNELPQENFVKWLKKTEILLKKWRTNQQDGDVAFGILETKLEMKSELDNLLKIFAELKTKLTEKQNSLLVEIQNHRSLIKCLSKKFQRAFLRPRETALGEVPDDLEIYYLAEIFQEFGLLLVPSDCNLPFKTHQVTNLQARFNPMFFDCKIKIFGALYYGKLDSATLAIFGQILENIPTLKSFTIILNELSESEFCLLSILLLLLKGLKEFSIGMKMGDEPRPVLAKFRDHLLSMKWFSRFNFQLETYSCGNEVLKAQLIN